MKLKSRLKPKSTIIFLAMVFIFVYTLTRLQPFRTLPVVAPSTPDEAQTLNLPQGWKISDRNKGNTLFKLEKESVAQIKPVILLASSSLPASSDPKVFTDRLVRGARATLPSLRYSSDSADHKDDTYIRKLKGYYYNSRTKIELEQQIHIIDASVYTLTVSYQSGSVNSQEVTSVVDQLVKLSVK